MTKNDTQTIAKNRAEIKIVKFDYDNQMADIQLELSIQLA